MKIKNRSKFLFIDSFIFFFQRFYILVISIVFRIKRLIFCLIVLKLIFYLIL